MQHSGVVRTVLALCLSLPVASAAPAETAAPPTRGPIVLELFTSQGCSSCPRADEVVSGLGLDEATRRLVIPLAFHVDYWNQIGWTDPFSSYAWTLRQAAYCRELKVNGGPYTPQLVVDGQSELNGGQEAKVRAQIETALRAPSQARVTLEARPPEPGKSGLAVTVAADLPEPIEARKLELRVVVYENALVTAVSQGENGGRTLKNDFVVRRLDSAASFDPKKDKRVQREMRLKLDGDWKREHLGVAAFLQDPSSLRIYASAVLPPGAATP
jgi:hypothetical protein